MAGRPGRPVRHHRRDPPCPRPADSQPLGGAGLATAIVVAGGLSTPPLEAGLRALWPSVLPDPRLRHAALALDTGTQGLLYIVGPLLVAALACTHSPTTALAVTAVLGMAGTAAVALAPPSRRWRPAPPAQVPARETPRLASPALVLLFASLVGIGFAIGAMNVWAVSMAEQYRQEMLSGILPASFSTGSFLGGLLYGRRHWNSTTISRLVTVAGAFVAGWLPLLFLPGPYAATVAVAVPGAFLTVVVACAYVTTDTLAPAARTSEAYAWLILSIGVGQSAGIALCGRLAEQPLATAVFPPPAPPSRSPFCSPHAAGSYHHAQPTSSPCPFPLPPPPIGDPPCPTH
ncbi:MFS transporter [Streptomyces sp. NPDC048737]|uniref:MFS transporter n=1 Tax=unclassified Streptomyces TaxID=2593676 RepID=UPI00342476D3